MRLEPLVCALFARPSAANSRRHRPPEWLLAGARPALRSSRKASPTGRSAVEDMMELGLTRAPLRHGSDARPSQPPRLALGLGNGSNVAQDAFRPPKLNAGCRLRKETIAGMGTGETRR